MSRDAAVMTDYDRFYAAVGAAAAMLDRDAVALQLRLMLPVRTEREFGAADALADRLWELRP